MLAEAFDIEFDDVAGQQAHELAEAVHQMLHSEDHLRGGAVLNRLPVQLQPQLQILRIRNLVARDEERPDPREGVAALVLQDGNKRRDEGGVRTILLRSPQQFGFVTSDVKIRVNHLLVFRV